MDTSTTNKPILLIVKPSNSEHEAPIDHDMLLKYHWPVTVSSFKETFEILTNYNCNMISTSIESILEQSFESSKTFISTVRTICACAGREPPKILVYGRNFTDVHIIKDLIDAGFDAIDMHAESAVEEKWGTATKVPEKEKGKYKGWSLAELRKSYNALKKRGPFKKGSAELGRLRELAFAIRAKTGWSKVSEKR
jgi:uncharacterized protein (DUF3820 family)